MRGEMGMFWWFRMLIGLAIFSALALALAAGLHRSLEKGVAAVRGGKISLRAKPMQFWATIFLQAVLVMMCLFGAGGILLMMIVEIVR